MQPYRSCKRDTNGWTDNSKLLLSVSYETSVVGLAWGIALCVWLGAASLRLASVAGSWRPVGQFVSGTAQIREHLVGDRWASLCQELLR